MNDEHRDKNGYGTIVGATIGGIFVLIAAFVPYIYSNFLVSRVASAPSPSPAPVVLSATLDHPLRVDTKFVAGGYMGDAEQAETSIRQVNEGEQVNGRSLVVTRFTYQPARIGWAGVYWLYPDGKFDRQPGLDLSGAKAVTFLARGARGGEIVEFFCGGVDYESLRKHTTGRVSLTDQWQSYTIPLAGADLHNVVGGFGFAVARQGDQEVSFTVAEIQYVW